MLRKEFGALKKMMLYLKGICKMDHLGVALRKNYKVKFKISLFLIFYVVKGRTENSVKNRFYSTVRKLLSDSSKDLVE